MNLWSRPVSTLTRETQVRMGCTLGKRYVVVFTRVLSLVSTVGVGFRGVTEGKRESYFRFTDGLRASGSGTC